jgi:acyl carrier protein
VSIEIFIEKFAYAIEVDASSLKPETVYKDLSIWDSLNTLSVIAMADADYGVTIRGSDVEVCTTIGDLWILVESRMEKK